MTLIIGYRNDPDHGIGREHSRQIREVVTPPGAYLNVMLSMR
jgi:hypothetical protein